MKKTIIASCLMLASGLAHAEPLSHQEKVQTLGKMFANADACFLLLSQPRLADDNIETLELIGEMYTAIGAWTKDASNEDYDTFIKANDAEKAVIETRPVEEFGCKFNGLFIMGYTIGVALSE